MQEAGYRRSDHPSPASCRAHVSILEQITIGCHIRKLRLQIIEHEMEWEELTVVHQHRAHLLRTHTNSRHRLRLKTVWVDRAGEEKDVDVVLRSAATLMRIVSIHLNSMV